MSKSFSLANINSISPYSSQYLLDQSNIHLNEALNELYNTSKNMVISSAGIIRGAAIISSIGFGTFGFTMAAGNGVGTALKIMSLCSAFKQVLPVGITPINLLEGVLKQALCVAINNKQWVVPAAIAKQCLTHPVDVFVTMPQSLVFGCKDLLSDFCVVPKILKDFASAGIYFVGGTCVAPLDIVSTMFNNSEWEQLQITNNFKENASEISPPVINTKVLAVDHDDKLEEDLDCLQREANEIVFNLTTLEASYNKYVDETALNESQYSINYQQNFLQLIINAKSDLNEVNEKIEKLTKTINLHEDWTDIIDSSSDQNESLDEGWELMEGVPESDDQIGCEHLLGDIADSGSSHL